MSKRWIAIIRFLFLAAFIWISVLVMADEEFRSPLLSSFEWTSLLIMTTVYTSAFLFRALAWKMFLQDQITFRSSIIGIFYSFVLNHILPIKAGDLIRAGVISMRHELSYKRSLSSVILLRGLDLMTLATFASIGAFIYGYQISVWLFFLAVLGTVALAFVAWKLQDKIGWLKQGFIHIKGLGFKYATGILSLTILSWILEGIVLYQVAQQFLSPLGYLQSVWVNSLTVAGQVFHFTPGGLGTYESVMTAVLVFIGYGMKTGYSIGLTTHLFKFLLSFLIGIGLVIWTPIPIQTIRGWIKRKGEKS
ncbi:lysylphosphatidylglycerol synthase transmembrane domain-containing protein [Pseudalkalibacillus sp. Hm43]|uniref:lysylphosphatidylglycerol synthase transmembrane domain-containing protein n=1 Tax=Pseudalkalibacillus sp. Hm43 TaxID=3450742 RepID=UPI003F43194B